MYVSQLRMFGASREDFGIMKNSRFAERFRPQSRFEFYKLFNRHYFADPNNDIGNAWQFGHVTSTVGTPREYRFGARFEW